MHTEAIDNKILEVIGDNSITIGGENILHDQVWPELEKSGEEAARKKYFEVLRDFKIRIGTLLKTDNVSFLIGAGCSLAAGGKSLASIPIELERYLLEQGMIEDEPEQWLSIFYDVVGLLTGNEANNFDSVERKRMLEELDDSTNSQEQDDDTTSEQAKDLAIKLNVEEFFNRLYSWRSSIADGKVDITLKVSEGKAIALADLDKLISNLTKGLVERCLPNDINADDLEVHRFMIKKVLTRPLNLRRVNLFTLNYDTLIEQAADAGGVVLIDGFVGTLKRVFRPESFDQDLYFPAQTTEGRVHRLDRVAHLYKLHGSITWHRVEPTADNPYGLYATFYNQEYYNDDILIYPTPLKYGQTLGLPYSELFRRFATAIVQPQSILFTIGYSFGDEHVNAIIRQAMAIPSFTLVIIDPNPKGKFLDILRERADQRVWIISGYGHEGEKGLQGLGTFRGFVEQLLPDLREEDIQKRVAGTFNALVSVNSRRNGKDKELSAGDE